MRSALSRKAAASATRGFATTATTATHDGPSAAPAAATVVSSSSSTVATACAVRSPSTSSSAATASSFAQPITTAIASVHAVTASSAASASSASHSPSSSIIRIQQRFQASAAAARSTQQQGVNLDSIPKELRFFVEFDRTDQDLHFELLEEAHLKHGVFLNVPPQLPPDVTPPEVPEPIIGEKTMARLRSLKMAYAPTHAPPPFDTCGTRGIDNILITPQQQQGGTAAAKQSSSPPPSSSSLDQQPSAKTAAAEETAAPTTAADEDASAAATEGRKAIDADAKYHCSYCHKAFRVRLAGEHHVLSVHSKVVAATLVEGPGEGEILSRSGGGDAAPPSATTAATPTPAAASPSTAAAAPRLTNIGETIAAAKKADYTKPEVTLPLDAEIEEMLKEVWDAMGVKLKVKNFKESTAIVAGVADKRPPPGSEHLKPSHSATPMGVAPGIKKNVSAQGLPISIVTGKVMTLKEMSARFANPFGDSDLFADFDEDDNRNPFLPVDTPTSSTTAAGGSAAVKDVDGGVKTDGLRLSKRLTSTKESSEKTKENSINLSSCENSKRLARHYACHLCHQSFRLLDSLHSHYEDAHETTMPDEVLRKALALNPSAAVYEDKVPSARAAALAAAAENKSGEGDSKDGENDNNNSDDSMFGSGGGGGSGSDSLAELIPVPIDQSDIAIHMRAQSNTVIIGDVLEVKRGFIKTHCVMQLIVKTSVEREGLPSAAIKKEDADLITVRCYGDGFNTPQAMNEFRVGSQVMVNGTLKLNRRLDKVSNRVHSFPYVLVMSPQGSIQTIE